MRKVLSGIDFGTALKEMKSGSLISREGWNGKGMFLYLNKGSVPITPNPTSPTPGLIDGVRETLFDLGPGKTIVRLPNINMKSASGATVTGWLAGIADRHAGGRLVCCSIRRGNRTGKRTSVKITPGL